ncbi:MAG: dihydropteroate synthase [Bacteriovorax sp.]|nr:dihydropteroate synthase [Rhizobacter sp.]
MTNSHAELATHWQTSRFLIDLNRPQVMGIVNITPDSFSDGGQTANTAAALVRCEQLLHEGADLLDLGAESTRPGSLPVKAADELARLLPVLEGALKLGCPISVDTNKPEVMAAVLANGADIINDINALRTRGALDVVAGHSRCGVCLMHMRGTPESMQSGPHYEGDVVDEVSQFLRARAHALAACGVAGERIVFDPGIGFGKSVQHNIELLRRQPELLALRRPLLLGWSRKSTLGAITGRDVTQRLAASVAAALAAVQWGASIVRVHDVAATVDALRVWRAAGLGR